MIVEGLVLSCRNDLTEVWIFDQDGYTLAYGGPYDSNVKDYYHYEVEYFELEPRETIYGESIYDLNITLEV